MRDVLPSVPEPEGSGKFSDSGSWLLVYQGLSAACRQQVAQIVRSNAAALATRFYNEMLSDPQASRLLTVEAVSTRLHSSLARWLVTLFYGYDENKVEAVIAQQVLVGGVHARIGVQVPLVLRGARILKGALAGELARCDNLGRAELVAAQTYCGQLIDLAMEVMSASYLTDASRATRTDEAYRLFSLGQDVSMERERQRAALMEWGQALLLDLCYRDRRSVLTPLRTSTFGLWMYHKGRAIFDGMPELAPLMQTAGEIDSALLTQLKTAEPHSNAEREIVEQLHQRVGEIKFLLNAAFDRISALDAGRDPLTQVLNRRFLPSVLAREISLASRTNSGFAVMMIDIDYFKRINDEHGHDGGDAVLRQAAEVLRNACRVSDYLFRYGGEEFLMLLVDTEIEGLATAAERVRQAFVERSFSLNDGTALSITVSIGAALFDGHPDPDRLVTRADHALYAAKQAGRNGYVIDSCDVGERIGR